MYAVEFQAPIENGIVHIPKQYQELQDNKRATFVVMYERMDCPVKETSINDELDELFSNSSNEVQVTMKLATKTDGLTNDGIL